jgi:HSP20 family protein
MANSLQQWDPFAGRSNLHSQLDDIFNSFFSAAPALPMQQTAALDVYTEDDKHLVAEAQLPGFTKDDVEINVHDNVLEIKGEKHSKDEDKKGKRNYMVRESHSRFYRSIGLPKHADEDKVKAEFKDGVLKVTVPFKELPKPKRVAIEAGK